MDVITLQPGSSASRQPSERPDWTPLAQPPDKFGIIAHTPDPSGYHYDATGRVIVPRATRFGGSRAYNVRENSAVVNIDPTDPVRGTGGITVRMGTIDKQTMKHACEEAGEDATLAWAIASQQANQVSAQDPNQRGTLGVKANGPPPGYSGYVVPKASPTGGQSIQQPWHPSVQAQVVPGGMNGHSSFHPAVVKTAVSPAIQGPEMARPAPIPDQSQQMQPLPQQVYQQPQQQMPPQQVYQQPQYQQPQFQQPAPDPNAAMMAMMGQMMSQFTQALQNLQHPQPAYNPPTHAGPVAYPPVPPYRQDRPQASYTGVPGDEDEEEEDDAWTPPDKLPSRPASPRRAAGAIYADCKLPFLTSPPSKPQYRVIFDLGKGGKHSKHFHEIAVQGVCLSLIYDDRYDGDRFIPMESEPGESITVKLPKRQDEDGNEIPAQNYRVAVPNFHQTIGCLDILNLVILPTGERIPSPREMLEEDQYQS